MRHKFLLPILSICFVLVGSSPSPLSVPPSTQWYGDDGTWSAISIRVGTPEQWADVLVSTALSEIWVVGTGGCANDSICAANRGNIVDPYKSSTWQPEGAFDLSLDPQLGFEGYAEYGLDRIDFGTSNVSAPSIIVGSINTTEYWLGFFGLGIIPGSFTQNTVLGPISVLVETANVIPSHSYGYTAGAKYQQKGEPVSLTLGGYDENRLVDHDISFELNPSSQPQVYVNSISVASNIGSGNSISLVSTTDRISANIDSSTPYLWLPPTVCNRFAEALGLTYNKTLNLYTFDANTSQHTNLSESEINFTFLLSDLGSSTKLVNITLPYAAFDLRLTFPFIPNTTYGSDDASKYYFPLAQASNEAQYTIGRAFLQEAYLIVDYERNNFSVHQAVHTANPLYNTSIITILSPSNSAFTGNPTNSSVGSGNSSAGSESRRMSLSSGAVAGIVIGCVALLGLVAFGLWYWRHNRRSPRNSIRIDNGKDIKPEFGTPLDGLSRFSRPRTVQEVPGDAHYPTEVGTDTTYARFELPADMPLELHSDSNTLSGTTDFGSMHHAYPPEKVEPDATHPALRLHTLHSPISPVTANGYSSNGELSPMTPRFVANSSPPRYARAERDSPTGFLGPLPETIRLPPELVPRSIASSGGTTVATGTNYSSTDSTWGSNYTDDERAAIVGDLFDSDGVTAHELEFQRQQAREKFRAEEFQQIRNGIQVRGENPYGNQRRLRGSDIVHVPQPAHRRFSFEDAEGTM
ncbi:eukaryotic aspartyl protease protein [Rutstroemia sp. NJR-2017a WRK4]|nr:eukaryotic aspartyl protease protein [Rutstroemia sp. NJR-2017a WRK4]